MILQPFKIISKNERYCSSGNVSHQVSQSSNKDVSRPEHHRPEWTQPQIPPGPTRCLQLISQIQSQSQHHQRQHQQHRPASSIRLRRNPRLPNTAPPPSSRNHPLLAKRCRGRRHLLQLATQRTSEYVSPSSIPSAYEVLAHG